MDTSKYPLCDNCGKPTYVFVGPNHECLPCYAAGLEHGHIHGLHMDENGKDQPFPHCPLCQPALKRKMAALKRMLSREAKKHGHILAHDGLLMSTGPVWSPEDIAQCAMCSRTVQVWIDDNGETQIEGSLNVDCRRV